MKIRDLFAKKRDKDSGVVMEDIDPYLIEQFAKVFVGLWGLAELEYAVFDANAILVIYGLKLESMHMAKAVKVYWLKLVLENPHNFFVEKTCKAEWNVQDFGRDLTGDLVLLIHQQPPSRSEGSRNHDRHYRRHNSGLRLFYHQFLPEPCFYLSERQLGLKLAIGRFKDDPGLL